MTRRAAFLNTVNASASATDVKVTIQSRAELSARSDADTFTSWMPSICGVGIHRQDILLNKEEMGFVQIIGKWSLSRR